MRKINLRTVEGWSEKVSNKGKFHCDVDGERLFIAPHGGVYCDKVHEHVAAQNFISVPQVAA